MDAARSTQFIESVRQGKAPVAEAPVIIGTGLIALDVIMGADRSHEHVLAAGGTCGNVLAVLSYLGWMAYPVGRLKGDAASGDAASVLVRDDLQRWGVNLDFASLTPTAATPIIVQVIRREQRGSPTHRFSLSCPACGTWFPSFRAVTRRAAQEVIDNIVTLKPAGFAPKVFFFDRVSRGALLLAKAFAADGALVVFEPSGVGDPSLFAEALAVSHVLKYSHERLSRLGTRRMTHSCLLEIETHGAAGLRYRSSLNGSRAWQALEAIGAPDTVDTAGAGDWCTAGLLSQLATSGLGGLANASPNDLKDGIRFGQAAAAMACSYEGARGVMYTHSRTIFEQEVSSIFSPVRREKRAHDLSSTGESKTGSASNWRDLCVPKLRSPISTICPACG